MSVASAGSSPRRSGEQRPRVSPTLSTETTPLLADGGRFLLSTELGPSQSSLASSDSASSTWTAVKDLARRLFPSLCYFSSIAGFYVFAWLLWTLLHTRYGLPRQVAPVTNGSFSGLAAWDHVKAITEAPHMYNSRENLRVREYIKEQLRELQVRASATNRTGMVVLENDPINLVNANTYYESSNILVRLSGTSKGREALLISAHFDSTPLSHGVTDDGIAIGAMLDTIRALLDLPQLERDIIFNFNNGEEMGLYGGYSFLLHKWFKDVKAFVNLEGTGAAPGTRSILFRTNSYELTNLMAYTPYPHVSILFNEMMRFVKSDTDYRPYSTLGRLPGIDIAFYSYRHLYHTPQDDIKHSHPISLQHMGDNLLAYIKTAGDIGLLLKLSQAPIVPDPQGNLPIPSFLYYDLYGFYFTVFNALTYKTLQTLLLLACLALGIGKLIIDGSYRSGVTSIYNQSFMPFIRAYLLIFLAVFSSIFFVLILSVLKCFLNPSSTYGYPGLNASWIIVTVLASFSFILWLKPVIENYFNVHQVDYTVILSSPILGREDVLHHSIHINSPSKVTLERDLLFNALIGFWTTLLIFSFLASAVFNMKATYFIFDWAFASIVAVVVIFAFNTIMTKWNPAVDTEDGNQDNNVQAFLVRVKATFIRHSWVLFFVSATIAPSLMTMDIFEEFMKAFPSLIAEGLSSIAVDVIFTLFTCLFLVNAIPPLMQCKTGSLTVTLCFLAIPLYIAALVIFPLTPLTPQKLAFSHSWNLNSNLSSVEFMVAPTMSQDSFTLWMKEWMPSLSNPSCVRHADKRDSTACTYSVGPPIFNGDKTKPMMSLDWMSVNESVVQANWTGSPDSRICSFSLNMIPGSDLSLHLDGNVLSSWKLIDGSRPRLETPVSDVTKPVLLMRREFTLSTRMNTTLLLVGNHRRLQSLSVKCYHSELENTFVSAVFKDLNQVKPDWLTFHHGRYGGISIEQDFPFTSTSHQLE